MTRIIAGDAGSLRLTAPAKVSRPTSDRVREAIFSRLESLSDISGATVLDLFAGTGALGLEAASTGRARCGWSRITPGQPRCWRPNRPGGKTPHPRTHPSQCHLERGAVFSGDTTGEVSLAFLDPPYDYSASALDDHLVALAPWLAPDALVVVERSTKGRTAPVSRRV